MNLQPYHYAALERALAAFEAHAKRITENDPFDHDAMFPEGDANSIKEIIHYLKATQAPNDYLAGWIIGYQQAKSIEGVYSTALAQQIEKLTADRNRYKAWHDEVKSLETATTLYTTINRRQFFTEKQPFGSIPVAVIVRPQPLKENPL